MMLASVLAMMLAGCSCGDDADAIRVSGDEGYVRCLAADAPEPRAWQVGALHLTTSEDRSLRIEGLPRSARVAVFRGPMSASAVHALDRAALAVVLGGIAASRREADASLASLAALEVPVLLIAGGGDRHDALREALAALEGGARDRIVDATPLRSIRLGAVELVPLAGAPEGRYARSSEACGLTEDDLDDVADDLGAPAHGVKRYLFSWAAPRGEGASSASRGIGGVEAGSQALRDFAEHIGAVGAVFAWPVESPTPREDDPLRVAVGPLAGGWVELADGTRRAPAATLLTLTPDGLAVADVSP
jgi:hypothetical protein